MNRKVSMPTAIVQRAQQLYPERLQGAVDYLGTNPPYGKERITRAKADNQLVRMLPDQLQALAQSDPKAYMDAQQRLATLQDKSTNQEPLPAQGAFEGQS